MTTTKKTSVGLSRSVVIRYTVGTGYGSTMYGKKEEGPAAPQSV